MTATVIDFLARYLLENNYNNFYSTKTLFLHFCVYNYKYTQ